VQELSSNVVALVETLHIFDVIKVLSRHESLLHVYLAVVSAHVIHDCNLGWNFSLGGPSSLKECLNLGLVLGDIVVVDVLNAIHIEHRRVVEIMREREKGSSIVKQSSCG
jgi:hypothetical protein